MIKQIFIFIIALGFSACTGSKVKTSRNSPEMEEGETSGANATAGTINQSSGTGSSGSSGSSGSTGSSSTGSTSTGGSGTSSGSGSSGSSGTSPAPELPPPEPTGLNATADSSIQISLAWTSGGGTTAGYIIAYASGATAPADCSTGTVIPANQVTGTSKAISNLVPNTQYSFRVCAINANATPDVSNGIIDEATTAVSDGVPPNAPASLAIEDGTLSLINSWPTSSGGALATGYLLVRRAGSAVTWTPTANATYADGQDLDGGTHFVAYVGVDLSADDGVLASGTTYHYAVFAYDVEKDYSGATQASKLLKKQVYRSVQAAGNTALAVGTGNALTIANNLASFAEDLPLNVGLGDALEYDSNNDGTVDAIAFISRRVDAKNFYVLSAAATSATNTSSDDEDWNIFRAYTSLYNAENGTENSGIDDAVEAFELFTNGRDLTNGANDEIWNIALYGSIAPDITSVDFTGWTTGSNNYLRLFTPKDTWEVGVSQRHQGVWDDNLYRLEGDLGTDSPKGLLYLPTGYVRVEGVQIYLTQTRANDQFALWIRHNGINGSYISQNIIRGPRVGVNNYSLLIAYTNPGAGESGFAKIWNNILYDCRSSQPTATGIFFNADGLEGYAFNNTIYNTDYGISAINGDLTAINNLVQANTEGFLDTVPFNVASNYNISNFADAPGANSILGSATYVDATNRILHLAAADTLATNAGTSLLNHVDISFNSDIAGNPRSTNWDIGAHEKRTSPIAPIAFSESKEVATNMPRTLVLRGRDLNWQNLTYSIVSNPTHGTLNTSALPTVIYTPNNAYTGADSFSFKVSDGSLDSQAVAVSLQVGTYYHRVGYLPVNVDLDNLNGLESLDTVCQAQAIAAGLGSLRWKAVASTETIDARDHVTINMPVRNINSDLLADDAADLWTNGVATDISYDLAGNFNAFQTYATGSLANGTKDAGATCNSWTSSANVVVTAGEAGSSGTGWVTGYGTNCSFMIPFLCIDRQ